MITAIQTHRLRAARRRLTRLGTSAAMLKGSRILVALRDWVRRRCAEASLRRAGFATGTGGLHRGYFGATDRQAGDCVSDMAFIGGAITSSPACELARTAGLTGGISASTAVATVGAIVDHATPSVDLDVAAHEQHRLELLAGALHARLHA